jgi:hypothetical protein
MAIVQIDGSSAVTQSSTVNNGGSAAKVGTSSVLSNVSVARSNTDVFASTVLDNDSADKAISGGTFAHSHTGPIAKPVTTEIAGVSSSVLSTTAGQPGLIRSINKLEVLRTTKTASGIRANKYNRYTGAWDSNYPQVSTDSPGTDTAATPTRSSPGDLVFKLGQPLPVTDRDYSAKNG